MGKLLILVIVMFINVNLFGQMASVSIIKQDGKVINGILISISIEKVEVETDGDTSSTLEISAKDIKSINFFDRTELIFPITTNDIPYQYRDIDDLQETKSESIKNRIFREIYLFGGSSYKNVVFSQNASGYKMDISYKNKGFAGLGLTWLFIGKNHRPDVLLGFESSFYGAEMKCFSTYLLHEIVFKGFALCFDFNFAIYPIKAKNKFPSPFIFAGFGAREIWLSEVGGRQSSAKELDGEVPFGLGLRQKLSKIIAFQITERFVYSKLKGADAFILPETRFELVIAL